jgi:hypothetical protein
MEVLQLGRSNDDSITFITIHLRVLHDPSGRGGGAAISRSWDVRRGGSSYLCGASVIVMPSASQACEIWSRAAK